MFERLLNMYTVPEDSPVVRSYTCHVIEKKRFAYINIACKVISHKTTCLRPLSKTHVLLCKIFFTFRIFYRWTKRCRNITRWTVSRNWLSNQTCSSQDEDLLLLSHHTPPTSKSALGKYSACDVCRVKTHTLSI